MYASLGMKNGPCICGAYDCRSCRPEADRDPPTCWKCGDDLVIDENILDPDDECCLRCKGWIECPVCGRLAHPDDGFEDTCGHPDAEAVAA